jgi:hypothetical protein
MDEVENSLNQLLQYLVMPHSFTLSDTNLNFGNLNEFSVNSPTKSVCRHLQVSNFICLRYGEKCKLLVSSSEVLWWG